MTVTSSSRSNNMESSTPHRVDAARSILTDLALLDNVPCAKLKLDEFLFEFLSSNHSLLRSLIADFESGCLPTSLTALPELSSPHLSSPRTKASLPRSPRSPRTGGFSSSNASSSSPRSPRHKSLSSSLSPPMKGPTVSSSGIVSPGGRGSSISFNLALSPSEKLSQSSEGNSPGGMRMRRKNEEDSEDEESVDEAQEELEEKKWKAIPKFFTAGSEKGKLDADEEKTFLEETDRYFDGIGDGEKIAMNDFVSACKDLCNFPTFFNGPLCRRIKVLWQANKNRAHSEEEKESSEGKRESKLMDDSDNLMISKEEFLHFWRTELVPFDEHERFFRLVKQPHASVIVPTDFLPYLEELLAYHPGLEFLENTPEFQDKYARTVIARILYEVNTSLNGKITSRELRKSDLLRACHHVDEEEDINLVLRYFSYEHFYTLYVKFWELDTDHDFLLSKEDIMRHGGHSLTPAIVDRVFQQPVYKFLSGVPDKMSYEDFVFFFLAEEDKTNPVSMRYWFKCVDLDGDGVIRPWEMKYFYNQQLSRLQNYGHEVIPFADVLCQAHDFVHPKKEGCFVLSDFTKSSCMHISGTLFNILFNLNKFIAFEQRDPYWIRQQHEHPELTEWDRYAAAEYARLASAEEEREMEEESLTSWSGESDAISWGHDA